MEAIIPLVLFVGPILLIIYPALLLALAPMLLAFGGVMGVCMLIGILIGLCRRVATAVAARRATR